MSQKLDELIWTNKMELDNIIQNRFLSRAHSAINNAGRDLAKIVSAWPAKKEDGGWGILFSTYKATCRRHGSKTKSEKSRDFNEDILEPYLKKIATDWDQAFGHLIPTALDRLVAAFGQGLREFHSTMSSRAELEKSKMASLRILGQQITNYEASMQEKVVSMKATLQEEQRQASRTFLPEIKKQMEKTYEQVASEKGTNSLSTVHQCFANMMKSRQGMLFAHEKSHEQASRQEQVCHLPQGDPACDD